MKKLQGNAGFKLAVWALTIACAFLSTLFACKVLLAGPYALDSNGGWQKNDAFQVLCQKWGNSVATAVADDIAVKSGSISYVERQQLESALKEFEEAADASATSYRFRLMDAAGQELTTNVPEGETLLSSVGQIYYASFVPGEYMAHKLDSYGYYAKYYGWMEENKTAAATTDDPIEEADPSSDEDSLYLLEYGVAAQPPVPDVFAQLQRYCASAAAYWMTWAGTAAALALGTLCALAAALWCSGWRTGAEGPETMWADRVCTEVWLMIAGLAAVLFAWGIAELSDPLTAWYHYDSLWPGDRLYKLALMGMAAMVTGMYLTLALLLRTMAVRSKTHTLVHSTLVLRVLVWMFRSIRTAVCNVSVMWKAAVVFLAYTAFNFVAFTDVGRYNGGFVLMWFLVQAGALALACWWSISFQRLCLGTRAMAEGDLDNRVDTHRMPHDLQLHGEDLNNISMGLSAAVDEKMKSERFKAELITNVSHDLKTPLTSIINYVNLLRSTQQTDPKALEYIEVLDRKSQRLKKLTEDLVEASKASTGVLKVEREKIGMEQLVDQALGEWEEKLTARNLTVVKMLPEGETWVYADGRHLWRVVDNLLSNCSKYAMEGTRIYVELTRGKGKAALAVKNISREAITVPAERLIERFVRGEESRNTEGSGLGLSIARSLTELQGGDFQVTADGDLFKATVTLPLAN